MKKTIPAQAEATKNRTPALNKAPELDCLKVQVEYHKMIAAQTAFAHFQSQMELAQAEFDKAKSNANALLAEIFAAAGLSRDDFELDVGAREFRLHASGGSRPN